MNRFDLMVVDFERYRTENAALNPVHSEKLSCAQWRAAAAGFNPVF